MATDLYAPGELRYADLVTGPEGLGVKWRKGGMDPASGLDCRGLAFILLARAGLEIPKWWPGVDIEFDEDAYLGEMREGWEEVHAADRLGDMIVVTLKGHPTHVWVLVDAKRFGALTITATGGVHLVRVATIQSPNRVIRFKGVTA